MADLIVRLRGGIPETFKDMGDGTFARVVSTSGVGGGLTDAELRDTPVPVSGNFAASSAGDAAHDAVDSGNPVKIGGRANDGDGWRAAVSNGDRVDASYSPKGIAYVAVVNPNTGDASTQAVSGQVSVEHLGDASELMVAAGAVGTVSAKLRRLTQGVEDLKTAPLVAGDANIGNVDVVTMPDVVVSTLPALAVGANAIGKLAANSGVDIGDVDVTSVPADPFGTNADAVVAAGAVGSISAKLRRISQGVEDLKTTAIVAGSANIGDVDVLTVPADPFGANADAVVAAGAVGSISAKLRRISQGIEDLKTTALVAGSANIGDVDVLTVPAPLSTTGAGTVATAQRITLGSDDPAVAALQVMDDWDESDRAKVNLIAGQAGITAGAGAVAASTPRVTHASDDPVTTALQVIDDWDESDRAKVNSITGQAGVDGGAGSVSAKTQRVTHASDDPAVAALVAIQGVLAPSAASFIHDNVEFTTAQTSVTIYPPTSTKKFCITSMRITTSGTTAGMVTVYFGEGAYSAGTSKTVFRGNLIPSATASPGVVMTFPMAFVGGEDEDLKITTVGDIDVYVMFEGYEID